MASLTITTTITTTGTIIIVLKSAARSCFHRQQLSSSLLASRSSWLVSIIIISTITIIMTCFHHHHLQVPKDSMHLLRSAKPGESDLPWWVICTNSNWNGWDYYTTAPSVQTIISWLHRRLLSKHHNFPYLLFRSGMTFGLAISSIWYWCSDQVLFRFVTCTCTCYLLSPLYGTGVPTRFFLDLLEDNVHYKTQN